ncbi:hypothetical protein M1146_05830 [Patescibacteria group bacterium]|nr:hypothetical protein [Patescibacteria group bacterium]
MLQPFITQVLTSLRLNQYKNTKDLRVLVCGGDGTAKMVIDAIEAAYWPHGTPPVRYLLDTSSFFLVGNLPNRYW